MRIKISIILLAFIGLWACSEKDKETSIVTLKLSKEEIKADSKDAVDFQVFLNNTADITKQAHLYKDGELFKENQFTSDKGGKHTFYAVYNSIKSKEQTLSVTSSLTVELSKTEIVANNTDKVSFTILLDGKQDVTQKAKLFVNSKEITEREFKTDKADTYTIYATYDNLKSAEQTITATSSLSMELDKTEIVANNTDKVSFKILLNGNQDVSQKAKLFVNSKETAEREFKTDKADTYTFYATYNNLRTADYTVKAKSQVISLTASKATFTQATTDSVRFDVQLNNTTDISKDSKIWFKAKSVTDFQELSTGLKFANQNLGTYQFKAEYNSSFSEIVEVEVVASGTPQKYVKKILIEDYTATWCGYCVRLLYPLNEITTKNKNVIGLALHGRDQMTFSHIGTLMNTFNVRGYPTGKTNRIHDWNGSENSLNQYLNQEAKLGLAINSSINNNTLNVSVKVGFSENIADDLKVVVVVSEDGLIYDQSNYYNNQAGPWQNQGHPIKNFEHNHVARASLTDILGNAIPSANSSNAQMYQVDFSKATSSLKVSNMNKAHIVAFVVNSNNEVLNVQDVKAGENKDFDKK